MCRDIANGGRRCPSHTNPVLVATRNAKRREAYAERKGHFTGSISLISKPNYLGVTVTKNSGPEIDNFYLSQNTYTGVIDYTQLHEESYKDFGFMAPEENRSSIQDLIQMIDYSGEELKDLTKEEKSGLTFFTSNNFKWFNACLYGNSPPPSLLSKEEDSLTIHNPYLPKGVEEGTYLPEKAKTPALIREITNAMDNALAKAPKKQRVVYRGMGIHNAAFLDETGTIVGVDDYVDKNLKLGQEMVFDGYQSCAMDSRLGIGYAGEQGLVLELLTSSGVNITSVSELDFETEVILPRNSRYMVVGVHKRTGVMNGLFKAPKTTIVQLVEIDENGAIETGNMNLPPALTDKQLYG